MKTAGLKTGGPLNSLPYSIRHGSPILRVDVPHSTFGYVTRTVILKSC